MSNIKQLIIIGAGGYSKSVVDSIDQNKVKISGFIDEYTQSENHMGFPILGHDIDCIDKLYDYSYFIAIGNNEKRKIWFEKLANKNLDIINVIDKTAIISQEASLGIGCFVGKSAIVNRLAKIADNCIINTRALIEHGCDIHSHVNISTNTVLNGDVEIGECSFIGSSSVIIGQITIGDRSTIGAGAVVINNIKANATAVGIPAKIIREGALLGYE